MSPFIEWTELKKTACSGWNSLSLIINWLCFELIPGRIGASGHQRTSSGFLRHRWCWCCWSWKQKPRNYRGKYILQDPSTLPFSNCKCSRWDIILLTASILQLYQLNCGQRCHWHPLRLPSSRFWSWLPVAYTGCLHHRLLAYLNGKCAGCFSE